MQIIQKCMLLNTYTKGKTTMKLQNGSGSIVCLDKTGTKRRKPYAVRVTTGWKDGKQVRKYIGYYATQPEAIAALAEYHKNGVDVDLTKLSVEEVYDRWYKRLERKNSTSVLSSARTLNKHIQPLLKVQFCKLKTTILQDWLDEIDLKPSSKGKLRSSIHQLFEFAVANDIAAKNYASGLEINEKVEKTGAVFTDKELAYLWEHQDVEIVRIILILIYTSTRIGELLLIHRKDIDLENGYMVGGIKTTAGKDRVIPLHHRIIPLVEKQLEKGDYLITKRTGEKLTYRGFYTNFQTFMKKLGWEHTIHDTRKTGISLMHSAGIPIETVRIIAGHSGKGVTERVYIYKSPQELVDMLNTMEIPY